MAINIVTGASGFVGKKLVQKLAADKNNHVVAVVRNEASDVSGIDDLKNVEIVYCEMENIKLLSERISYEAADVFFHLAWEGSTGVKRADYEIQMKNVLWVADAFKVAECLNCNKFLCAGTISERILDQVAILKTVSQNMIYAQAKKAAYELLKIISKNSNTKLVWMQFSNVYGPGNTTGNLISYTLTELCEGRIPEYGSGNQPYNFIYIDDLISGICCLACSELKKNLYFIGSDEIRLLKEFLKIIPDSIGMNVKLGIGKRKDDGVIYEFDWFDISDLKEETNYMSQYSFAEGISLVYQKRGK